MTGRQIANNLRYSRRKWGRDSLMPAPNMYCTLALKAKEAGAPDKALELVDMGSHPFNIYNRSVLFLAKLNDKADSKIDLIRTLDSKKYRNRNFPVEAWIKKLKAVYRQYLVDIGKDS